MMLGFKTVMSVICMKWGISHCCQVCVLVCNNCYSSFVFRTVSDLNSTGFRTRTDASCRKVVYSCSFLVIHVVGQKVLLW